MKKVIVLFTISTTVIVIIATSIITGVLQKETKAYEATEPPAPVLTEDEEVETVTEEHKVDSLSIQLYMNMLTDSVQDIDVATKFFDTYGDKISNEWIIEAVEGRCTCFQLSDKTSEEVFMQLFKFSEDVYVFYSSFEHLYIYNHGDINFQFAELYAKNLEYLVQQFSTYDWSLEESIVLAGVISERYDINTAQFIDDYIQVDENTRCYYGNGYFDFRDEESEIGERYSLYERLVPVEEPLVDKSGWCPAESFTVEVLSETLEVDLSGVLPEPLPEVPNWFYEDADSDITVWAVEENSNYEDNIRKYKLFELFADGTCKIYY